MQGEAELTESGLWSRPWLEEFYPLVLCVGQVRVTQRGKPGDSHLAPLNQLIMREPGTKPGMLRTTLLTSGKSY